MTKEEKATLAMYAVDFSIGYLGGTALKCLIHPYCGKFEKVITTIGMCGIAQVASIKFNEDVFKPFMASYDINLE